MNRNIIRFLSAILIVFFATTVDAKPLQLQVYVTSNQVTELLGDEAKRASALKTFNELGVTKLYLETVRGGNKPAEDMLIAVRDYFQAQGLEISGAVATTRGNDFCMPSNQRGIWINYQNPKTQQDMANHFAWIAGIFDEIMIDDFFATDDMSEESIQAKGDRDWSDYRLQLMTEFAKDFVIKPAREANPDVEMILKFPQWYDRFHKFGYNVVTAPELFDRIWVGTETRNPETLRFGFTMPTMGFNNYVWLKSFARDQIGGGWFDFGDCTPTSYLMQAYQTVLAGADELVLFQAHSVLAPDPCIEPLRKRRNAVAQLSSILNRQQLLGSMAYKPPHSEGSDANGAANLYVFDYFATLGLSPVMSGSSETNAQTVLLARQAADDPNIVDIVKEWLNEDKTLVMTPDFLSAVDQQELFALAGFSQPFALTSTHKAIDRFQINEDRIINNVTGVELRVIPKPDQADTVIAGISGDAVHPFLTQKSHPHGTVLVLNTATFAHEEFAPGKEQFLPPRPLTVKNLPVEVAQRLQQEVKYPYGIQVMGDNNLGVYFYGNNTMVLTNFTDHPIQTNLQFNGGIDVELNKGFEHLSESACALISQTRYASQYEVTIPAWELTVLSWESSN